MNKSNFIKIVFTLSTLTVTILVYYFITDLQTKPCPSKRYQSTIVTINEHEISVDIASTEDQRTCGLANRTSLPEDYGMLFVFEENQILDFWMKDTYIPLTVAYIDENYRIIELHQFIAEQQNINAASKKAGRYALESSPEWFIQNNIRVGNFVEFNLP